MKINGIEYKTIWFNEEKQVVKIIDQTKLPHKFIIKELSSVKEAINAIKTMEVRGAPLIGGTAAFGLVLAIKENNSLDFIKKNYMIRTHFKPSWAFYKILDLQFFTISREKLALLCCFSFTRKWPCLAPCTALASKYCILFEFQRVAYLES